MAKKLIIPFLLIVVFFFALFLRFYKIDTAPNALLVDEASIAYNAYAVSETGKDEYGSSYPLAFKAFGDQKMPLYIYSSIIPVKIFGLNILSVRLVAALASALLVVVVFFILRELDFDEWSSLVGSAVAAVSSWTIVLGRFGWEASLGLFCFSIALLFLLKCCRNGSSIHAAIAALFLGLTWYIYIPYRLISGVVAVAAVFICKGTIKSKIFFCIIFFVTILPLVPLLLSPSGTARFQQTSIFNNTGSAMTVNDERYFCNKDNPQVFCSIVSNKFIEIGSTILKTASRIFSINYLFVTSEGDGRLTNVGKFALLPIFLVPFYLLGIAYLFMHGKKLKNRRQIMLLAVAFGICVLPILIIKEPQRIQMSALSIFIFIIIVSGYSFLASKVKHAQILHYATLIALFVYGLLFIFYFTNIHARKSYGNEVFFADLSRYLATKYNNVDTIYVNPAYPDLLIFYAFYNKVDPIFYQQNIRLGNVDAAGFQHTIALGKIKFYSDNYMNIACSSKEKNENNLYVTNQNLVKEKKTTVDPIYIGKNAGELEVGYVYNLADIVTAKDCQELSNSLTIINLSFG